MDVSSLVARMERAFRRKNAKELRRINDAFVSLLIRERDPQLVRYAVISYILSKIVSKPRYMERKEKIKVIHSALLELIHSPKALDKVERAIVELDEEDPRFLFDLFTKAKVKLAATLYAKGVSLGVASKLTGIPKGEILSYAGKTMMFDRLKAEVDVKERVKRLERWLG